MYRPQPINEAEVKATWAPIIESATGIKDPEKLSWMSKYCHYHKLAEDAGMVDYGILTESMYNYVHLNPGMNVPGMGPVKSPGAPGTNADFYSQTPGSGDKPFSLLPLAMQVAAQTIALDLVPVIPLGGPYGMLTYLDFPYAGGDLKTGSATGTSGLGGADGQTAPLMIKANIPLPSISYSALGLSVNGSYSIQPNDELLVYDPVNDKYPFKFTYIGKSRIDGYSIFKVEANTTPNFGINGPYMAGFTSTITLADVMGPNNTTYDLYLYKYHDPSTGNLITLSSPVEIDQTGDTSNNLLKVSAELVKALEDHIPAFSGRGFKAGDVTSKDPYLREEGESTPANLIGLKLFNKSVTAQTYQVAAAVTREQVQDLKQFGIDAVAQVETVLINELTQSINKHILDRLFRLGVTNAKQVEDADGTNLSLYIASNPSTYTFNLGPGVDNNLPVSFNAVSAVIPTSGDNTGTLQRKILSRILAASNLIAIRGRRGAATFCVTNGQIATALQDIAGFVPYPLSNTVNQTAGSLYPIGSIAGMTVYVDPNMSWNDTRILVGRKGDGNSPGLVFMPYLMAESVQTIAEGTMAPKIAIKSRYALVEAGFHPQTMYYTLGVKFDDYSMI